MLNPTDLGLLIDDDELYVRTLQRSLSRRGLETRTATGIAEALRVAEEIRPAFALVDLRLGEDSGLTLIRPLRALRADMRILLVTGYASVATAVEAIKRGADDYLPKPATAPMILRTPGPGEAGKRYDRKHHDAVAPPRMGAHPSGPARDRRQRLGRRPPAGHAPALPAAQVGQETGAGTRGRGRLIGADATHRNNLVLCRCDISSHPHPPGKARSRLGKPLTGSPGGKSQPGNATIRRSLDPDQPDRMDVAA